MLTLQKVKTIAKWLNKFPEGVPLSEVLEKHHIPNTNHNKLIFISMLKYHPRLETKYVKKETIVICRECNTHHVGTPRS